MRIVLGNQHRLIIDALAEALSQEGVTVLARATSAQEVLAAVAMHEPDICMVAISFPVSSGLDLLRLIRRHHQAVKVVVLSDSSDHGIGSAAIAAGAAAFLGKEHRITEIVRTLVRVRAGERALSADLAGQRAFQFCSHVAADGDNLLRLLTLREQEVLMLMMQGESTKQIARSLTIALSTARTHVQSVLVKLGTHSRLEACSVAARSGLLGTSGQYSVGSLAQAAAAGG